MKRCLLSALAVGLCLTASVMAQVPSYVPSNGLVGWWPFNGNANDESGNGNNGTVNGATLTTDRNNSASKAYEFNGSNYIFINPNSSFNTPNISYSCWFNRINSSGNDALFAVRNNANDIRFSLHISDNNTGIGSYNGTPPFQEISYNLSNSNWYHVVFVFNNSLCNIYVNGVFSGSYSQVLGNSVNNDIWIGQPDNTTLYNSERWNGKIDDIGIWNRALTQQEITNLYNGCAGNEITTQPINSVNSVGSNAQFSVNAVAGSTFQWQNNPLNNGWQNVNNNSTYSGSTTNTLTISNTSVSNHNQPFRAIVNAGGCIDTSDVAQIIIGDTCLTTVTDTLIINTTLGLPAPNNENTILIYPNPASDHITIDNGNYTAMAGYTIKIENNAGQQVFQSLINQAQFYVDLSTWSGNGLYFVHLIDAQGNTVTVRKIVLQ